MNVLIACEFSGIVREEFRKKGHRAFSCDILPSEIPGRHFQCDVFQLLSRYPRWDLMIAFPPCTFLCNSGVRWLKNNPERLQKMKDARDFFLALYNDFDIPKVAVENPLPHCYADLPPYSQIIQPWQYGHGETKMTCLWLRNLPLLKPAKIVAGREGRVWKESPGKNRWKNRSRTYIGIARAMAEQWG